MRSRRWVGARPPGLDAAGFFLRVADTVDRLTLTQRGGTGRLARCKEATRAQYLADQSFSLGAPGASSAASTWPDNPSNAGYKPRNLE